MNIYLYNIKLLYTFIIIIIIINKHTEQVIRGVGVHTFYFFSLLFGYVYIIVYFYFLFLFDFDFYYYDYYFCFCHSFLNGFIVVFMQNVLFLFCLHIRNKHERKK